MEINIDFMLISPVILLQMQLEISCGLRGLYRLPLVHLHGLLAQLELLLHGGEALHQQPLLLLQLPHHLVLGLHLDCDL